jgi:hypothetical protein
LYRYTNLRLIVCSRFEGLKILIFGCIILENYLEERKIEEKKKLTHTQIHNSIEFKTIKLLLFLMKKKITMYKKKIKN